MNAERWQKVKAIFHGAVETDPQTRAEYVRVNCAGDLELQKEVEALLDSDRESSSVLDRPAPSRIGLDPAPMPVLKDRYEVERELGRGGMSVVYLARDRQLLSKHVVIKVLLETTRQDAWLRQKFSQEMEALSRIDHPGVVGVLDTGTTPEGQQFLVMQYIEGVTLRGAMVPGGMNFPRAAALIRQIGQALGAAHEKGVWHRDLKPENIMLQRLGGEEHVKLIDFGIAGIQNSRFGGEKSKVAGSLAYMAPEQFAGHPSAASDIYALGMVAYEILTGNSPYSPDSMMHLVAEDRTRLTPPRELRPDLPPAAERAILKALSFRPEQRPSTVREFSEELSHALTGQVHTRKPPSPGTVEMAHVLFIDLVGYSLLPMDRQKEYLAQLQQAVRESPRFQAAEEDGDLISLPTGDGMALAFFGDPTAPAQCAVELARALKSKPHLQLRMGIHSGPVYRVADVNANANVAGGGINMAQRVMDCGDAGHILVSRSVADVLAQLSQWAPFLTDLGECTVKHGVRLHICNLATPDAGNPARPGKLALPAQPRRRPRLPLKAIAAVALIAAIAGAIYWIAGRSSGARSAKPSIAVLPFVDMSQEKDQAFFSDGIAEELLNLLAHIPELRVAGRTSSFQFRDKTEDLRVIGKKLNVATVLEGSVRKQGTHRKITAQLINAADGFHIWSDTYDREMNDVFAVQEEIARAVAAALKVKLLGKKGGETAPINPQAHTAYLQGRYFLERRSKANLEKAIDYFEQATRIDPKYAKAWVGLSRSRSRYAVTGDVDFQENYRLAREAINRALALDPESGEAHAALAWIKHHRDWDWAGAEASYQKALELEPANSGIISNAAILIRAVGRMDQAVSLARRAIELEPLSGSDHYDAAMTFYYAGMNDEAVKTFRKVVDLIPERNFTHCFLGRTYLELSRPEEALAEMQQEREPALRLHGLALAYHALNRKKESDAALAELIKTYGPQVYYFIAGVCAYRGEKDQAFEWLDRAYTNHHIALVNLKGDPVFRNVRRDPRYAALLEKMGLSH